MLQSFRTRSTQFCFAWTNKTSARRISFPTSALSKVSEVLARKRPLGLAMIRSIHRHLDIPADILLGGTNDNDIDLSADPNYDYDRFPWQEMLDRGYLGDLAKLSRFEQGPALAVEFLANIGIVLVIEEHFKKTYLDGAAMLDGETPVIALTLRHDRVDNFWFALLHELIHVQKHLTPAHLFIADNLDDKSRSSAEEEEADEGATEALIPLAEWEGSEVKGAPSAKNANALADRLRIHPAIVAGRVRHEEGNWRLLSHIKAGVRQHFNDHPGGSASPS